MRAPGSGGSSVAGAAAVRSASSASVVSAAMARTGALPPPTRLRGAVGSACGFGARVGEPEDLHSMVVGVRHIETAQSIGSKRARVTQPSRLRPFAVEASEQAAVLGPHGETRRL